MRSFCDWFLKRALFLVRVFVRTKVAFHFRAVPRLYIGPINVKKDLISIIFILMSQKCHMIFSKLEEKKNSFFSIGVITLFPHLLGDNYNVLQFR